MLTLLVGDEFIVRGAVITGPVSRRLTPGRGRLQTSSPSVTRLPIDRGATAEADSEADPDKRPFRDFGFLVIGIVGLLIGAVLTVDGSVFIARAMTRLRLQ